MPYFNHIMLDLETLGTRPNAPILTIGAVMFDPEDQVLGKEFYVAINVSDAMRYGVADPETLKWWMVQSDQAREALVAGKATLESALIDLREFCGTSWPKTKMWSNGPSFDAVILEYAYHRVLGTKAPWDFWNVRCCRTVAELAGLRSPKIGGKGVHHNALDDSKHQAEWVMSMWHTLRQRMKPGTATKPAAEQKAVAKHSHLDDL